MTSPAADPPRAEPWTMRNGTQAVIRPIRPEDEPMMARFHGTLSPESVYTRYFNVMKLSRRTAHERLCGVCHPDPAKDAVLVAEAATPEDSGDDGGNSRQIIGVGRLSGFGGGSAGEVALVVSDSHQRQGLGIELMRRLIGIARERRLTRLYAHILSGNPAMQRLCLNVGMRIPGRSDSGEVTAELDL